MKEKTDLKQVYIPTIEEMQSWYEDDLRKEALKSSEYDNNKKIEEQGEFFKAFRKFEERDYEISLDSKKTMFITKNIKLMWKKKQKTRAKRYNKLKIQLNMKSFSFA